MRIMKHKGALIAHRVFTSTEKAANFADDWRTFNKNASVRTFHRTVHVDRLAIPLNIVVVREKLPKEAA